ncbi:MAG: DUF2062 domain-containing protein [Candidatus Rokubacteria bacterium]|nr:DUF2062 domain-containing protein [Candidatus Rokubacteria bacterium]
MLWSGRGMIRRLTAVLHLGDVPWKIALGLAVGVFIGCTPFYGLHTLLAIVVAFALRVNRVATVTGAWLNLPWFAPFVYGFSLKVGEFILSGGKGLESLSGKGLVELATAIRPYLSFERFREGFLASSKLLFVASTPLFVGTTVVGIAAGLVTYFVALGAIREVRRMGHLDRTQNPAREG